MDFETYLTRADAHFRYVRNTTIPDYRKGQAFYNYLGDPDGADRGDLADAVTVAGYDPFYLDSNLPDFLLFLKDNW